MLPPQSFGKTVNQKEKFQNMFFFLFPLSLHSGDPPSIIRRRMTDGGFWHTYSSRSGWYRKMGLDDRRRTDHYGTPKTDRTVVQTLYLVLTSSVHNTNKSFRTFSFLLFKRACDNRGLKCNSSYSDTYIGSWYLYKSRYISEFIIHSVCSPPSLVPE